MATTEQLVTGVDFVPFSTQDLDKAVEFYGETLGLRRSVYIPERQYAEFETGNVTFSVVVGEAMGIGHRSEEHTSELQSRRDLVCRLLPEKKNGRQGTTLRPPEWRICPGGSVRAAPR